MKTPIGNMALCNGSYDCIASFHNRNCKVKQRIVDDAAVKKFNEAVDAACERHELKELVWKIYEDREKVLKAITALKDILK